MRYVVLALVIEVWPALLRPKGWKFQKCCPNQTSAPVLAKRPRQLLVLFVLWVELSSAFDGFDGFGIFLFKEGDDGQLGIDHPPLPVRLDRVVLHQLFKLLTRQGILLTINEQPGQDEPG